MLRLLADENFSHRILRALNLRSRNLDIIVAQRAGLSGQRDPALLAWVADQGRVILTHDRQTLPKHAYRRVRSHQRMPGIIVVSDLMPIGEAVDSLMIFVECGDDKDFENLVLFLP